ncbi:MAG: hypothetical protein HY271_17895 [Deltaproteobacteria bacterium]|nr:hypothetical protein [Deltaproteobacteria bacterium]
MTTVELIERVVRLELQQAPLEVLASEMLAPLLEALDARAGALLCYRRDEGALALAAGRGLAASAAEQLAMVRWGGAGTWEMPLRALLERRVYYIGAGELRPFVAELMGADETSTITAIPLHRWHQPVGVVLAIGDRDVEPERILAHGLAYDVLAIALGAALWGGPRTAASDAAAGPPPTLVCEAWRDVGTHGLVHGGTTVDGRLADSAAIDAMLRDLRGAVDGLRAERRLEEAERLALAERLAKAEGARAEHAARTAMLERELERHTAMLTGPRGEPAGDASAAVLAESNEIDALDVAPLQAPSVDAMPNDTPAPAHCVLDTDSTRRKAIAAALGAAIPNPSGGGLVAANLCDASVALLAEVTAAARDGATVIAYAADDTRSRILGTVRCFAEPPASGEVTAGLESQPRGGRRLISLSDDIDAFIPAKVELAKLGYSVSMACDDKQAIDLLALLNPDAVLVDLRKTPEAAAMFIDALAPEGGRMLMLLVHGNPEQGALRRALERLMRPTPLDAVEFARVCRLVVGNLTAASRAAAKSTLRPVERADTKLKRAGARA